MQLDEFIIMPNHIHGIIVIDNENQKNNICRNVDSSRFKNKSNIDNAKNAINRVSTGGVTKQYNPMLYENLATIIRWFKGRCSFEINKSQNQINFKWQPRYYDHIIRNEESLNKIQQYIFDNPMNWDKDEENLEFKKRM